jgi:Protein of unknown function (DUF4231)
VSRSSAGAITSDRNEAVTPAEERLIMSDDTTMARLEDQIGWYDRRSGTSQRRYKALKVTVIVIAALIPLLSGLPLAPLLPGGLPTWVLGALGAAIAIIEGIQQVNQYHSNWISYRSTCEALKHEKYLYLGKAGPYAAVAAPHALLAERVESLVSQEHAKWASTQEIATKPVSQPADRNAAGVAPDANEGDAPPGDRH